MTDLDGSTSTLADLGNGTVVFGQVDEYEPQQSSETSFAPELSGPVRLYYPDSNDSNVVVRFTHAPSQLLSAAMRNRIRRLFK